jgi:UDP-N-acetylglucosamine--N-acetylmuramyl-(pentapeptide) pyrophosphoryl-undecaprenol N-acetylglucosamine transferase
MAYSFVLTGGGTGGHVFPALAVGKVLQQRGHRLLFLGTREGMEARLVPPSGIEMEFIRSSGLNRVGWRKQLQSASQLPFNIAAAWSLLRKHRPDAIFSTGGYVAGPVMLAGLASRTPIVLMEPNMTPGLTNRKIAPWVQRALLGFPATQQWFPKGKSEVTGLPVRAEFFEVTPKREGPFTVLITGASRGARTLNEASRQSWPLFRERNSPVRLIHQAGAAANYAELERDFASSGMTGEITQFIPDMAGAFTRADLVICRSGAGTVNEISAAGMPSVLVPLPHAADDHQRKNAEALVSANAARLVLDRELTGERLFQLVEELRASPEELARMRKNVRQFAKLGAALRAADVMEEVAQKHRAG